MTQKQLPTIPLHEPYGVFSAALVIICHFSDLMFSKIDLGLTDLYGVSWQRKFQTENLLSSEFNGRDPQAVLKELARNGSSQFRLPLNSQISREKLSYFYNGVDDLLGERNAWVHRQLSESIPELKELAQTTTELLKVSFDEFNYTDWIHDLLETTAISNKGSARNENKVKDHQLQVNSSEGLQMEKPHRIDLIMGDPVTARFLTHSYVVEEKGDISDRNTGVKLSEFNSEYRKSLSILLADLKIGSRLRLTESGQLCSFFEDHWGFLTEISSKDWFPNHLK